jgi:hypothetical protein
VFLSAFLFDRYKYFKLICGINSVIKSKKYYEYINAKGNINKGVFYSLLCIVFVLKISCSTLFFYIKVF